jgi:hypothetical protein
MQSKFYNFYNSLSQRIKEYLVEGSVHFSKVSNKIIRASIECQGTLLHEIVSIVTDFITQQPESHFVEIKPDFKVSNTFAESIAQGGSDSYSSIWKAGSEASKPYPKTIVIRGYSLATS